MIVRLTRAQIWQLADFSEKYAEAHIRGTAGTIHPMFDRQKDESPEDAVKRQWQESMGPDLKTLPLTFYADGSAVLDFTPKEAPQVVDAEVVEEVPKKSRKVTTKKASKRNGRSK